jgi:asparagine synthase (glutamine-hydrolysing)
VCGIFGVVGASLPDATVKRVIELLRHRGPDDSGAVKVSAGVLAHTRLAIIDLSPLGRQPMATHDASAWITLNGEIYNYLELRDELAGYPFRTQTDTEVVLAAYERWGEGCLSRLRGMFAFGLWDERRRTLLCATDRFSIKPLYYARHGGAFWFSSGVKPLAACGVPLAPNDRAIFAYLAYGLLDHDEQTLFRNVYQLQPGRFLRYRDGEISVVRYWDLPDEVPEDQAAQMEDTALSEIGEALDEAVRLHLRGDVEIALSLSSGLDSNLLRALIPHNGAATRRCYTYSFPGTVYDEGFRVERLLTRDPRWALSKTEVREDRLLQELTEAVTQVEEPLGGLGVHGYWLNARTVGASGVKVLLDGQGADEVFAGYKYYYELWLGHLAARGREGELARELAAFNRVHGTAVAYPGPAFDAMARRDSPETLMRAPDGTTMASSYMTREFVRAHDGTAFEFPKRFGCPVRQARYLDLFHLKIPKLLRFQDRCAMAWGVEVRVPYLDHALVERLFALPARLLLQDGFTKTILRRLARLRLPDWPQEEPKLYVAAPQREWLKGSLRPDVLALIGDSALGRAGYVDTAVLRRQFEDYCLDPELGNSFFAWKFIVLELWYRNFITAAPPLVAVAG